MICKNCGAIIKQGEDYCRKCGSLVVSFKDKENSSLKYICIENNLKGKFLSIINKLNILSYLDYVQIITTLYLLYTIFYIL